MKHLNINSEKELFDIIEKYTNKNQQTPRSFYFTIDTFASYCEEKERNKFIDKTKQDYNPLSEFYTDDNLISEIKEQISSLLEDNNITINIKDVILSGSRCRGLENPDSDIDIILHYDGDFKEDALFNILNKFPIILESQIVDINPVRDEEHNFIEYLHGVEEYLDNKRHDIIANNTPKTRLFVDIDGTLAVFKPVDTLETLYEKGYFLNLEPHENVVAAVNELYFQEIPEEFVTVGAAVDFMDLNSICILPEEEQREIKKLFGRSEG